MGLAVRRTDDLMMIVLGPVFLPPISVYVRVCACVSMYQS